jgi:hypothetical protein
MRRLLTYLMVAASLVFAFIILQGRYGLTQRLQRWRSDFSSSDLRKKNYQLNFDVAGQKGTISIKTQPSQAPDKSTSKQSAKSAPGQHKKTATSSQETAQSGTKQQ